MKIIGCLSSLIIASAVGSLAPVASIAQTAIEPTPFVYAQGLEGPRGLRFGPDGYLYVAEAGTGGSNSTGMTCTQVIGPVGPYKGGPNARISKISPEGTRTTVASGFPSSVDAMGDLIGVAGVVFLGGTV